MFTLMDGTKNSPTIKAISFLVRGKELLMLEKIYKDSGWKSSGEKAARGGGKS